MSLARLPTLLLLTPGTPLVAFPFLPTPIFKTLSKVSVPLPNSSKQEENLLEEQLQTRQIFVLGHKLPPSLIS